MADWIGAGLIYFVLTRVDGSGGRISGVLITGVGIEVEGKGMNFMIVWYGYYGKRGYYGNLEGILRRVLRKENGELKASKK